MSEQVAAENLGEDLEIEAQPKKGLKGKTLVLFIILPILLLWIAAPAPLYIWLIVWLIMRFG